MVKRRRVGPSYEKSPIQQLHEWSTKNLLVFIMIVISWVVYCFLINIMVDGLFNLLATDGKDDVLKPFSSNDDMWGVTKLIGCIVIAIIFIRTKAK